ncbi:unnamed protein product [Effrenium voratum]|uniref:EF-hand domain-containing protein n=1 Tax=Effrenium voratum TaxID=2562239 RepID=A0AA36J6S2_9DINO|nr:unnamed protein product [Effrenium voratum]
MSEGGATNIIRIALRNWNKDSLLRAWFDHFDDDRNGFLEKDEFFAACDEITSHSDPQQLWEHLDSDKTGYVSLREISEDDASLWFDFKAWCAATFSGPKDMLVQISGTSTEEERLLQKQNARSKLFGLRSPTARATGAPVSLRTGEEACTVIVGEETWVSGLLRCGWSRQLQELFYALKDERRGVIDAHALKWLEIEVRKFKQKQEMKRRIGADQRAKAAARKSQRVHLHDFKAFLKKHFGPTYHAWRKVLDVDGTMNLQKAELFKVCRQIGWKGDSRLLWQALDNSGNGTANLEELDPSCARQLARFKDFGEKRYGSRPAMSLWKAIDKRDKQRISYDVFVRRCIVMRSGLLESELKELAYWLDWQGKKHVCFADIEFIDHWRPPAYLVAEPNPQAAEQIRSLLAAKYGHFLKAWRTLLDKDSSNVCNWEEFQNAMKHLKHNGDVAGAWLALDNDLSGSITLQEIDSKSSQMLLNFKSWADAQFGSVRAAFKVLDKDKSGELSLPEFRHAVLSNGLSSCDEVLLFKCLDCSGHGRLLLHEVHFLDDWEPRQDEEKGDEDETKTISQSATWTEASADTMYSYATLAPGPGAYNLLSGFGAHPRVPMARHMGAHAFSGRPQTSWLKTTIQSVGPGAFEKDPKDSATQRRHKPSWQFATTDRMPNQVSDSPGPGHYQAQPAFNGPQFSFGCRRGFTLHPLEKPPLSARTNTGKYCFS